MSVIQSCTVFHATFFHSVSLKGAQVLTMVKRYASS